jgi:hypothetical protein
MFCIQQIVRYEVKNINMAHILYSKSFMFSESLKELYSNIFRTTKWIYSILDSLQNRWRLLIYLLKTTAGRNGVTWGSVYLTPLNFNINIRWFSRLSASYGRLNSGEICGYPVNMRVGVFQSLYLAVKNFRYLLP